MTADSELLGDFLEDDIKWTFEKMVANKGNTLKIDDFVKLLQGFRIFPGQEKYLFEVVDPNGVGSVDYKSFKRFILALKAVQDDNVQPLLKLMFQACAKTNKNGMTLKEFVKFRKMNGLKTSFFQRRRLFRKFDRNGSGLVEWEDIMTCLEETNSQNENASRGAEKSRYH